MYTWSSVPLTPASQEPVTADVGWDGEQPSPWRLITVHTQGLSHIFICWGFCGLKSWVIYPDDSAFQSCELEIAPMVFPFAPSPAQFYRNPERTNLFGSASCNSMLKVPPPKKKKKLFSAFWASVKLEPTKWTKGGVLTPGIGYSGCEVTKETRMAAGFLSLSWDSAQTSHMPSHAQAPRMHRGINALAHLSQQGSSSSEQHPPFHTSLLTCKGSEYVSYWKTKKRN